VDSDGDGVYDDDDYCPDTPRGATVDNRGCWVLQGIEFETNKAEIRPAFEPELESVVTVLKDNPTVRIQVQGHTDSVGNAEYNRVLSERRAKAVMEYLIQEGIDRKRLSAIGLGEARPIASNDSAEGRERNRRVELKPMP
jgi:OOP family OmpA-OmpF porin